MTNSQISLLRAFLKMKTPAQMQDLLDGLFTPQERETLQTRLDVIQLLKQGVPQHEIAERLGVGIATVTRGSREIKNNHFKYI